MNTPAPAKKPLILPCDGTQELPVPAAAPANDPAPLAMARRMVGLGFYPDAGCDSLTWRKDLPCGGHIHITTNGYTDPERTAYCVFGYDAEGVMRKRYLWRSLGAALEFQSGIARFPETPAEEKTLLAALASVGVTAEPGGMEIGSRFFYGPEPERRIHGAFTCEEAAAHFAALGIRSGAPVDGAAP